MEGNAIIAIKTIKEEIKKNNTMKKNLAKSSIINLQLLILLFGFWSCEREKPNTDPVETSNTHIAYILNEGVWGSNNAEISVLDSNGVVNDWFSRNNGRGLGDVAQDMIHYGSKLYVSVYMSNTVEVVDAATGKSLRQIDMGQRGPRYMAAHQGKVYVTCYDRSVVRIDTATLSIEASCPLSGMQPEAICEAGGKLYVCNSWQYDENGHVVYDNTISVVDIATFAEVEKITVWTNPIRAKRLDDNTIVVACEGDYGDKEPRTLLLNLTTHGFAALPVAATNFDIKGTDIYLYNISYGADWTPEAHFYRVASATGTPTPILAEYGSRLNNAYGINVHPTSGELFVTTSVYGSNSDLFILSEGGEIRSHEVGIYASKVVF